MGSAHNPRPFEKGRSKLFKKVRANTPLNPNLPLFDIKHADVVNKEGIPHGGPRLLGGGVQPALAVALDLGGDQNKQRIITEEILDLAVFHAVNKVGVAGISAFNSSIAFCTSVAVRPETVLS